MGTERPGHKIIAGKRPETRLKRIESTNVRDKSLLKEKNPSEQPQRKNLMQLDILV